jgi:hypothetical protein
MKARTLVLILCIGPMCLTGFGNTTTDLTENSTDKLVQTDCLLNVAATPVMDVVFDSLPLEAVSLSENRVVILVPEFVTNNTLVSTVNLPDKDVGWKTNKQDYNSSTTLNLPYEDNDLSTSESLKDPGGVLSLFYGIDQIEI